MICFANRWRTLMDLLFACAFSKAAQAFQPGIVQHKNSLNRLCRLQTVSRSFDSAGSFASE